MADTTNACMLPTRLVSCTYMILLSPQARHEAFCCYVTYRIVYRIMTTISRYVSYCGKMYRCRPSGDGDRGMGQGRSVYMTVIFRWYQSCLTCLPDGKYDYLPVTVNIFAELLKFLVCCALSLRILLCQGKNHLMHKVQLSCGLYQRTSNHKTNNVKSVHKLEVLL